MGCINTEKPGSLARSLPRFLREQTYHSYAPCASSVAQLLSLGSTSEGTDLGWYRPEPKLRTPDIPRPAHSSICSKLGFRFQANIRPGATGHIKQKPSLELMQLVKQGFRFSLGSSWQLRFTQEETSRKSESQLKQRRSSTNKTNHPLNLSTIPTAHLLSLGSG